MKYLEEYIPNSDYPGRRGQWGNFTFHISVLIELCCKQVLILDLLYMLIQDIPKSSWVPLEGKLSEPLHIWRPVHFTLTLECPHAIVAEHGILGANELPGIYGDVPPLSPGIWYWQWEVKCQSALCSLARNIILLSRRSRYSAHPWSS